MSYYLNDKIKQTYPYLIAILITASILLLLFYIFQPIETGLTNFYTENLPNLIVVLLFWVGAYCLKKYLTPYFLIVLILIVSRISFDAIVLPLRLRLDPLLSYKNEALRIAENYNDNPLFIYKETTIDHFTSHYIMVTQDRTLPRVKVKDESIGAYYLIEKRHFNKNKFIKIDSLHQKWEDKTIYIVK